MSRPRKDKEHKFSKVVVFRLTKAELEKLEEYSENCGRATGVMVRDKLFSGSFPKQLVPQSNHQLYAELNRIGNNLNQIARRATAGFFTKAIRSYCWTCSSNEREVTNFLKTLYQIHQLSLDNQQALL